MNLLGSRSAMPYVAGVPSKALPQADGVVRYSLIGAPFMISENPTTCMRPWRMRTAAAIESIRPRSVVRT